MENRKCILRSGFSWKWRFLGVFLVARRGKRGWQWLPTSSLFRSPPPPTLKAKRPVGVEGALFFFLLLLPLHTRKRGKRASRGQQLGFSLSLPPLFLSYYRQTKIPSFVPWPYSRGPQAGNTISSNSSSSLYKPTTSSSSSFHSLIFLFFSNWRLKRNLF